MFNTLYALRSTILTQYDTQLQVILRQHIQPWHPSSTLTHEAALAVLRVAPEKYWEFSAALFKHQVEFFDVSVVNETRNATYRRLANIAGSVGVDEGPILDLLTIPETPTEDGQLNVGNKVTNDLKWVIKVSKQPIVMLFDQQLIIDKTDRVVGVHVSPTVFFNVSEPIVGSLHILILSPGGGGARHQQQLHDSTVGGMASS